jgi:sodium pump decarboxylase gamma subunit
MFLALAYPFGEGLLESLFCILIVFAILYLITLAVEPLKKIGQSARMNPSPTPEVPAPKAFRIEDIQDEDMMVAALVAAIDARQTLKTDLIVKSVKEVH